MARTTVNQCMFVVARGCVGSALTGAAFILYASSAAGALDSILAGQGFDQPLFLTAPTGDNRVFVVEKGGAIKIMTGGSVLPTPFLNLNVSTAGEGGLLGLAFDPNFADPTKAGYRTFYVDYIHPTTGNTVVASYQVSASNPNLADGATAKTVFTVAQPPGRTNHKAGWIGFRPGEANNLYIATGDGGSGNDPENRAQNPNDNLGKILRVNVRSDAYPSDANRNYAIPAGNPFGKTPAGVDIPGNDEIWAYGLRNPFRNSFDRVTGDLYIGDVGENNREEVDFVAAGSAGENFGWRAREGTIHTPGNPGDPDPANATPPILDYERSFGSTVIGGYVVRGGALYDLEGVYLFGDFGSGRIWAIRYKGSFIDIAQATDVTDLFNPIVDPQTGQRLIAALSSFGEDGFGNLYLVDIGSGKIFAMVPEPGTWALLLVSVVPVVVLARRRASRLRPGPEPEAA